MDTKNTVENDVSSIGKIQKLPSEVLNVPLDGICPSFSFTNLGVDSLVATELLSKFKKRLGAAMTVEDLQSKPIFISLNNAFQHILPNFNGSPKQLPQKPLAPIAYDCIVKNTRSDFDAAA
ncbi:acyl carrier protein [Aspergillus ruber CBS 135680]|uniref:Carrier domain-containing protein n=1 Tax=Aspergillus ruber (strain CBS 135680) TaxID=1388766 RepID=A0A017S508_ASPRC|nr:uncharacterized protein EURHEDRAFT_381137 [Aspergillus ruber CBS 135680]EYE91270.1 hypothetical protein EURHEDRAFT_381137 [Aspergillus ruber CBS 135680]